MARGCYSVACLIPDMGVRCQQKISPRWGWIQFQFWGYKDVAPTALGGGASSRFYLVYFVARRVAQLYAVNFFQQRVRPIRHGHCQQSRGCENPRLMQRCRGAGAGGIEFS